MTAQGGLRTRFRFTRAGRHGGVAQSSREPIACKGMHTSTPSRRNIWPNPTHSQRAARHNVIINHVPSMTRTRRMRGATKCVRLLRRKGNSAYHPVKHNGRHPIFWMEGADFYPQQKHPWAKHPFCNLRIWRYQSEKGNFWDVQRTPETDF